MKNIIKSLSLSLLLITLSSAVFANHSPIDWPFDATFEEYRNLYIQQQLHSTPNQLINISSKNEDLSVDMSISAGERLHAWLKLINSNRAVEDQITLTKKDNEPILDKYKSLKEPREYGPSTIHKRANELLVEVPKPMVDVIYFGKTMTANVPVSDDEFAKWGQEVSLTYQRSVRWVSLQKWKDWYKRRRLQDIRGYFYLSNYSNLNKKLSDVKKLTKEELTLFKQSLVSNCMNNFALFDDSAYVIKICSNEYKTYINENNLIEYKEKYWQVAKQTWESYFVIQQPRKDIVWSPMSSNRMTIPFKNIESKPIANWLEFNVEDEFKFNRWEMDMVYTNQPQKNTSHLKFKKNTTPHVAEGNIIVMDENQSIDEYDTSWVIRHEFGHILRLPDCYFEYFDEERNLFVFYAIDISDLMCSRRGKMNQRIFDELKRVYFK